MRWSRPYRSSDKHRLLFPTCMSTRRNLGPEAASREWEPDYWIPCHSCNKPCEGSVSCCSSLSIAPAFACCMVKDAVPRQVVAVQVSGVSDETLPHEHSNSIVPGSLLV